MIPILKAGENLDRILRRSQLDHDAINQSVKAIIADVRQNGDEALFRYTKKFDGIELDASTITVSEEEIAKAYADTDEQIVNALQRAKDNIINYHKRQLRKSNVVTEDGRTTGYLIKPLKRAGIYVPGGKAAYPSSVLMCACPAIVAGVEEIVMTTPAGKWLNPLTLIAAHECGIKKIFKVGGAQAVAAMAYGTYSVPRVNIISGPGNIYVATAKREVFGDVGIDMIAGPSEILIIADDTANPEFVAADMLSQAEHDELALSLLLTTSPALADAVNAQLSVQLEKLPKKEIAEKALQTYGTIVLTDTIEQAVSIANQVAPEHLELCLANVSEYLPMIENAGAVFLGNYSPEPLGDYYAGPNHVLPTSGTAKYFSALGVDNYIKKISLIHYDKFSLEKAADDIVTLAETEGLSAHANTIRVRFKKG